MEEKLFDNKQQQEAFDRFKSLMGKKFGRLTVLNARLKFKRYYILCECECGTIKFFIQSHVETGKVKSCGCLARELSSKRLLEPNRNKQIVEAMQKRWQDDAFIEKMQIVNQNLWNNQDFKNKMINISRKRKGIPFRNSGTFYKGRETWNKGVPCEESIKERISNSLKGNTPWNKGKRIWQTSGEHNPNWNGGITPENTRLRTNIEYRIWRRQVFQDADYTCLISGERGKELQAHHILNFSDHPELRTDPQNGVCFSKEMHKMFHDFYGRKNNTVEQVIEYYFLMNLYKL